MCSTLLNVFISFWRFLLESLLFFLMYRIISSANKDILTSSFSIFTYFISLSCLFALCKTSSTMFNRSGGSRHPCSDPDFSGNDLNFSPFNMMLVVGFLNIAFIMLI